MSILVDEDEPDWDVELNAFERRDVTLRQDKWVLDEFQILGFLGRGKFGEVKSCREKCSDREFAAKFISVSSAQDRKDVNHEIDMMKKLQHRRLLQLYDAFESKTETCLVLEIVWGGELFDRVISDEFILTERACVVFMRQICEGVEYMHSMNVIHLDLKPENILCLTKTGNRIKIIDFGLAREFDPRSDLRVLFGTPEFMAPEVVNYEFITFATDMWSLGVICYVLLSGLSPFMGDNDGETMVNVMKGDYDFDYPEFEDVSEDAKDFIDKLLLLNKNKRMTAVDALSHPWLRRSKPPPRLTRILSKKKLRRFVIRRKWQKAFNAIVALRRMGVIVNETQRKSLYFGGGSTHTSYIDRLSPWDSGASCTTDTTLSDRDSQDAESIMSKDFCGSSDLVRTESMVSSDEGISLHIEETTFPYTTFNLAISQPLPSVSCFVNKTTPTDVSYSCQNVRATEGITNNVESKLNRPVSFPKYNQQQLRQPGQENQPQYLNKPISKIEKSRELQNDLRNAQDERKSPPKQDNKHSNLQFQATSTGNCYKSQNVPSSINVTTHQFPKQPQKQNFSTSQTHISSKSQPKSSSTAFSDGYRQNLIVTQSELKNKLPDEENKYFLAGSSNNKREVNKKSNKVPVKEDVSNSKNNKSLNIKTLSSVSKDIPLTQNTSKSKFNFKTLNNKLNYWTNNSSNHTELTPEQPVRKKSLEISDIYKTNVSSNNIPVSTLNECQKLEANKVKIPNSVCLNKFTPSSNKASVQTSSSKNSNSASRKFIESNPHVKNISKTLERLGSQKKKYRGPTPVECLMRNMNSKFMGLTKSTNIHSAAINHSEDTPLKSPTSPLMPQVVIEVPLPVSSSPKYKHGNNSFFNDEIPKLRIDLNNQRSDCLVDSPVGTQPKSFSIDTTAGKVVEIRSPEAIVSCAAKNSEISVVSPTTSNFVSPLNTVNKINNPGSCKDFDYIKQGKTHPHHKPLLLKEKTDHMHTYTPQSEKRQEVTNSNEPNKKELSTKFMILGNSNCQRPNSTATHTNTKVNKHHNDDKSHVQLVPDSPVSDKTPQSGTFLRDDANVHTTTASESLETRKWKSSQDVRERTPKLYTGSARRDLSEISEALVSSGNGCVSVGGGSATSVNSAKNTFGTALLQVDRAPSPSVTGEAVETLSLGQRRRNYLRTISPSNDVKYHMDNTHSSAPLSTNLKVRNSITTIETPLLTSPTVNVNEPYLGSFIPDQFNNKTNNLSSSVVSSSNLQLNNLSPLETQVNLNVQKSNPNPGTGRLSPKINTGKLITKKWPFTKKSS